MAAPILVALLLLIVLGALLIGAGLRGRRLNDHPVCRSCRFDLSGVYPAAATCPECGAGLKRPRAVMAGARGRVWPVVVLGLLLTAGPAALIGTVAFGLLTGANINDYKPLSLLMWEAARARGPRETQLVRELIDRVENHPLDLDTGTRISDLALRMNADRSGPRSPAWADLAESAHAQSLLSNMDHQRFLNESVELEVIARQRLPAGAPVPILVRTRDIRIGQKTLAVATLFLDEVRIGERPMARWKPAHEVYGWSQQVFAGTEQLFAQFMLAGPGSPAPTPGDQEFRLALSPDVVRGATAIAREELIDTSQLPPGPHRLTVSLYLDTVTPPAEDLFGHGFEPRYTASVGARRFEFTLPIEIVPADEAVVRLVPRSDDLDRTFEPMLRPNGVIARAWGQPSMVSVHVTLGRLPVEIAYDVFIRQGDRETSLGSFTSSEAFNTLWGQVDPGDSRWMSASRGLERVITGPVPTLGPGPVDVIFRASPAAAARTVDVQAIYGGDFIFRDVPVGDWLSR